MSETARKTHLVIGTAGHIDHGKTSLVKALTGTDTDSLKEEKKRGITIDLGFAFYGDRAAFVDVPGHERLIKNMVAGASAMRAALLVVAADDGVMPQTREHLSVLNALAVPRAVVAVTKADLADEEWIELVVEDVRELLEPTVFSGSPIVVVDSLSGRGLDTLRSELDRLVDSVQEEADPDFVRIPVDRSFTIKGYGRVVTGTVWSGEVKAGDRLNLLPQNVTVRVRGVQAHEKPVDSVVTGDRAAINLAGDVEVERGNVLLSAGRGISSDFMDVEVSLLPDAREIRHRTRIRFHSGTGESIGRLMVVGADAIAPGTTGYARLALEEPVAVMVGDRAVIRLYSPLETLGGARVIDPSPPDKKRTVHGLLDRMKQLASGRKEAIQAYIAARSFVRECTLIEYFPAHEEEIRSFLDSLGKEGKVFSIPSDAKWYVIPDAWNEWVKESEAVLHAFHEERPDEPGMPKAQWADRLSKKEMPDDIITALLSTLENNGSVKFQGGVVADPAHEVHLRKSDVPEAAKIMELLRSSGFNSPLQADIAKETGLTEENVRRILRAMKHIGDVVILDERVVITTEIFERTKEKLVRNFANSDGFSIGEAAEALESTRKYCIPFLEYLDREGITTRDGDKRRIR